MEGASESVWHFVLLVMTLGAIASAVILVLVPLAFETPPAGLARARPWLLGLIVVTAALYLLEWQILH